MWLTVSRLSVDTSNGFWEFTSTGYAVGSGSFKSSSIDGIADTGTTLLLLDDSIVSAYYAKVSGAAYDNSQGGYTFPCSATLPSFTVGIGSYKAVIPGSYMNYSPATGSCKYTNYSALLDMLLTDHNTACYGGLQSNEGIGFSIYGDIFLKSQFVVFDSDNTQLGVAAKTLSS